MDVSPGNQLSSLYLSLSSRFTLLPAGKKRAWVPDEKEAYIEIEIKERSADKVVVETKDGKVRIKHGENKLRESHFRPPQD